MLLVLSAGRSRLPIVDLESGWYILSGLKKCLRHPTIRRLLTHGTNVGLQTVENPDSRINFLASNIAAAQAPDRHYRIPRRGWRTRRKAAVKKALARL